MSEFYDKNFITYVNLLYDVFELYKYIDPTFYDNYGRNSLKIYCPFHDDRSGGKESGVLYRDTNLLWCYSEQRLFSPYDFLTKLMGYTYTDLYKAHSVAYYEDNPVNVLQDDNFYENKNNLYNLGSMLRSSQEHNDYKEGKISSEDYRLYLDSFIYSLL